jgi:pimeloyl-ACP methyl ester carboxylesterase
LTLPNAEQILPSFFRKDNKPLYASFHPALGDTRRVAVVLCYPLGDEYIRSHRSFRQLGVRLSRAGFPVLRFDYYGSGDSGGIDTDATLEQWRADIAAAIDELKQRVHVTQVFLAGLKLGAALAAQTAIGRSDIAGLVLWEPVIDGASYLAALREAHEHKLWYLAAKGEPPPEAPDGMEVLGFHMADPMIHEVKTLDLLKLSGKPAAKVYITEREPVQAVQQLRSHLESLGSQVEYQLIEGPSVWTDNTDKGLVPHQVLQGMVGWLTTQAS